MPKTFLTMPGLTISGAAALVLAGGLAAQAAPPAAGPVAALHQFIDNFNKGDVKAAEAAHTPDVVIIDDFPPHVWRGPNAFQAWTASLDKVSKAGGLTDEKMTLKAPARSEINGDTAYAVVPATLTFNQKGKAMIQQGRMTVALRKDAGAWKITGWTWTGAVPRAAATTKPK